MDSNTPHLSAILHRPPLPTFSDLFAPVSTPHSGLSLFASTSLERGAEIHQSGLPSASCVVKRWRKEVCEVCHEVIDNVGDGSVRKEVGRKGEGLRWFCSSGKAKGKGPDSDEEEVLEGCYDGWKELYREEGREGVKLFEEALEKSRKSRYKKSASASQAGSGAGTPRQTTEKSTPASVEGIQEGLRKVLQISPQRGDNEEDEDRAEAGLTEEYVEGQLEVAFQNYQLLFKAPTSTATPTARPSTPTTERLQSVSRTRDGSSRTRNESPRRLLKKLEDSATLTDEDDEDLLRFLLDGLIKKASEYHQEVDISSASYLALQPESWSSLLALVPSLPYFTSSPSASFFSPFSTFHSHLRLYHFILLSLRSHPPLLRHCTPITIFSLISRDTTNSFGSWGGESDPDPLSSSISLGDHGGQGELHGYSLLPSSSYFNHSCAPNMSKNRRGAAWTFFIKEELEKDVEEGEELCISYLGVDGETMGREERQRRLKISWGFDCGCKRCEREKGEKEVEAEVEKE